MVVFYRQKATSPKKVLEKVPRKGVQKNEGVNEGVNLLLQHIKKNPGKRVPHFEKALKTSPKTIERWLKKLKNEGRIEFQGSPKTGGYKVVKQSQ